MGDTAGNSWWGYSTSCLYMGWLVLYFLYEKYDPAYNHTVDTTYFGVSSVHCISRVVDQDLTNKDATSILEVRFRYFSTVPTPLWVLYSDFHNLPLDNLVFTLA